MYTDIITHKQEFVQVEIPENTDENQTFPEKKGFSRQIRVGIQDDAYVLYDAGLNIFPQPIGKKGGYPWKRLQYTRLNRNDRNYGLDNLFADRCNLAVMCGATSGNLFVIDCESIPALKHHMGQLRQRAIPLWVVKTARGGHIYLRCEDGEVENIEPNVMVDAEIKGRGGYVLAPPSIHPSGVPYEWLIREGNEPPLISAKQINWLTNRYHATLQLRVTKSTPLNEHGHWLAIPSPLSRLSRATNDYLEKGSQLGEGFRNKRLFNAACDLYGNKYSYAEIMSLLLPVASASGLQPREIKATIISACSQEREPAKPKKQTTTITQDWYYALLWTTQQTWQTRTASSDRALMLALIERARLGSNDNGTFRASIRELAELARLGTTTIQRSLERLKTAALIHNAGFDHATSAGLWRFSDDVLQLGKTMQLKTNTVCIPPHWLRFSVFLFNSDTVERGALGHGVGFIYQFMLTLDAPMMPSVIGESLGLSVNQVNYALRKLALAGLVNRLAEGWFPIAMTVPELETMFRSVEGKGSMRAERFRREREIFAGRILFEARRRAEGLPYLHAVEKAMTQRRFADVLDDPILSLGLELGAVLHLGDGRRVCSAML